MTIIQLQYVIKVAKYKNFTMAAEKSFVSQPTLSMQIQKLEKELDVEIFDRSSNPITITSIGKKIISQAKNILKESNHLIQTVEEEKHSMKGQISIGIIPTILPTLVPLFYKLFNSKYPEASLVIKELKTEEIIEKLQNDELDFGIASTPINANQIVEQPIYKEPLVYYLSENDPLFKKEIFEISDIDYSRLLLLEEGNCFRDIVLDLCQTRKKFKSKINLESGSFSTLVKLVDEGYGVTLLPLLETDNLNNSDKRNFRFFDPSPYREISLLYSTSQIRNTFTKNFVELIRSILRGKLYLEKSDNLPNIIVL